MNNKLDFFSKRHIACHFVGVCQLFELRYLKYSLVIWVYVKADPYIISRGKLLFVLYKLYNINDDLTSSLRGILRVCSTVIVSRYFINFCFLRFHKSKDIFKIKTGCLLFYACMPPFISAIFWAHCKNKSLKLLRFF